MTRGSIAPFVIIVVLPTLAWLAFVLIPRLRAKASIRRGLAESARGDIHYLGTFAETTTKENERG